MWREALLLAVAFAGRTFTQPDYCDPSQYRELDQKERSTSFRAEYPFTPLCDINLQQGWYRFTSPAGGVMPERCPGKMQCGTVIPIWLNGSHPSVSDGVVVRQACANFENPDSDSQCCEQSLNVGVRNCGTYFIYYLRATPACPISYCAGDKLPCPVGTSSRTGFPPCTGSFPKMTTDPVLKGPTIINNTFRLSCNIHYTTHDPDIAFDVVWTFDSDEDPSVQGEEILDPLRVAHLDGNKLRAHNMNKNIGCKVRSKFLSNSNVTSPWLRSNTYWAGIRTEPAQIIISEKAQTKTVTLTSTIPILCDHPLRCCLTVKVDVDGPKENAVTSHPCEYYLCQDVWNSTTNEASIQVPITATQDHINDGNKDLLLTFENITATGGNYQQIFDNYRPQSVPVDVQDVGTKSCSWTGDPHVHAMNHRETFHLFKVGDYTMIHNPNRHMSIQARTWPCGRVTCICGVVIREKDDVIRIDECDQPYRGHHTSPKLEVAGELREGTIVQRSTDGYHYMVYLPSGMEVRIDAHNSFLNTYITIPSIDQGDAIGICGTFDGVSGNEFTHPDGTVEQECAHRQRCVPENFTESWRNNRSTSLFETVPPRLNDLYVPKYCSCDKNVNRSARINCTPQGDIPNRNLRCPLCNQVTPITVPLPFAPTGWTRNRRSSQLYQDVDEMDPRFDADQYHDFQVGQASWPTPSGITEQQAEAKCREALQQSQLWSHCQHVTHITDLNLEDCVTDILYTDSFDMVESAMASFLTECQSTLSRDPANYVTNTEGKSVLKPEISDDVCSVFCYRHGHCVRGKCVCDAGYEGDNCHLLASRGPQLTRIRSNSTCDVSQRPCRKIFIDASNLEDRKTLSCRAQEVRVDGTLSAHFDVEKAEFLSAGRLACPLPGTRVKAVTTYSVSATNDGHVFGNEVHVIVYDGTCQSCDQQGQCTQLSSTCLINNVCHQNGDVNSADANKICDVSSSTTQWTNKQPSGSYPDMKAPTIGGPDDHLQMTCTVTTSTTDTDNARFQVIWYIDGEPRQGATLTDGDLESYFPLLNLPFRGQLTCATRSFYAGGSELSPYISSAGSVDLRTLRRNH